MRAGGPLVGGGKVLYFALCWAVVAGSLAVERVDAQEEGDTARQIAEEALARFERALRDEPGLRAETKDALRDLLDALHDERAGPKPIRPQPTDADVAEAVDAYLQAHPPAPAEPTWDRFFEHIDVYADLRLRHESHFARHDRSDRHRQRVRFRIGFTYPLDDEWTVGVRLITGNGDDPRSSHVTIGDGFDSFEVSLDRAYATYRPQGAPGVWVTAGKFAHPFKINPVYGELVWDGDIQPEGIAAGVGFDDVLGMDRLDVTIGQYVSIAQNDLDEGSIFVAQVSGRKGLSELVELVGTVGWYRYSDLTPDGSQVFVGDNRGNAVWRGEFQSRFSIVNPIASVTYRGFAMPLTWSGEWFQNIRAAHGEGTGWATGVAYGQAKRTGDYRVYYQYQELDQDSVLSPLAQDDFPLATNFRGHVFGLQYQVTDDLGVHLWGLLTEQRMQTDIFTNDDDHNEWRLRVDLNFKF